MGCTKIIRSRFGRLCIRAVRFVALSFLMALAFYAVFCYIYDTPGERELKAENRVLAAEYDSISERIERLDRVMSGIALRDRDIYHEIFESPLPSAMVSSATSNGLDFSELLDSKEQVLVDMASENLTSAGNTANKVSETMASLDDIFREKAGDIANIPSRVPVAGFTVGQTGASTGDKFNPFYKKKQMHRGLDIMASPGTDVIAASSGIVESVKYNGRTDGRVVTIDHGNGYKTVYRHLGSINVSVGRRVSGGDVIAKVGSSGRSFAPHLHYEVLKDGECLDPVHFFFGELDAVTAEKVLLMALTTGQSMD